MTDIPITVFTGFLGAGKTSIILSLLESLPKDYKVVLLKNEFGDVKGEINLLRDLDHQTLKLNQTFKNQK
jgi:G3E family GTPase